MSFSDSPRVALPSLTAFAFAATMLFALGGCSSHENTDTTTTTQAAAPAAQPDQKAADAAAADFPAGTELSEVGLPMYPTPKSNITIEAPETTGEGGKAETIRMDPHASLHDVVEWYKAHMPAGTYIESPNPTHASFQIGKDGDKVIRIVNLDHITGHVQTDILLIRKTLP